MNQLSPWHWRSLPLESRTGSEVFAALFQPGSSLAPGSIATLLESPYPVVGFDQQTPLQQAQARYSICAGSPRIIDGQPQVWTPAIGDILLQINRLLMRSQQTSSNNGPNHLPFTGGWLGWFGYDLAWEIERLPYLKPDSLPFPVAYWYEPGCFAVLDHWEQRLWLAATAVSQLDQMQQRLSETLQNQPGFQPEFADPTPANLTSPHSSTRFVTPQADYEAAVLQAKKYIQAGDIFQTNLSLRFEAQTRANSWSIYRQLQQINPSPFASYWQTPWGDVVSCSPERLVQLQGRHAQTRPIAGTRSRGMNPAQDQQHLQDLLSSAKEQAEHIMLVDLERNDLGKVCQWGSVVVDELLTVEHYSHVMHLVSNVAGNLRPECSPTDLIRSLFPGGTITGCPKVRCMEIIEELEPVRRSLFYGSCGYLDQRGYLDLNILIRTLLVQPASPTANAIHPGWHTVWGQVGAGIVADSNPEQEWFESLHKAQAQLAALQQVHW